MIASNSEIISEKAKAEGLSREQAVATFIASAMQAYAETHKAATADGTTLNPSPEWRYVNERCSDLITEIYVEDLPGARRKAGENRTLRCCSVASGHILQLFPS